jgi:hypothetical protein
MCSTRSRNASIIFGICWAVLGFAVLACAGPPESFERYKVPTVQVAEPGWTSIEVRDDLGFEQAWEEAVDLLAKRFDLEMISKDGGYARTTWAYDWLTPGEQSHDYRVRTVLKFSPDHKRLDLKSEAQYLNDGDWATGTDSRLLRTLKTDLMGVVGRTTR